MRKLLSLAAVAVIAGAGMASAQETPRKGGTIRMTAPYAASFGSLDPHTTPRTTMSRSVKVPTKRRPAHTGNEPTPIASMAIAACCSEASGGTVSTWRVMTSETCMQA